MFYAGGKIILNHQNEETGELEVEPNNIFISIFAMFFAASQASVSQAFGPDIGKAAAAVKRIFTIMEHPSKINAVEIDEDKQKKRVRPDEV
mmetsp:Transcript_6128/g.9832  ORF Transcript_6128/g.9832 Transcript_6128/m.9832 type:complete len:91 (-) Transcript_6128:994-1266(-)